MPVRLHDTQGLNRHIAKVLAELHRFSLTPADALWLEDLVRPRRLMVTEEAGE